MATLPLRSRITTDGIDRAPHRAFMRGMGLDDAAIARPFIGVVTTAGDTTPCNGTLAEQAAHAQEGVLSAGGMPRAFTTISVSDGLTMNHQGMSCSLVSRELIADSDRARGARSAYDGLFGFGGCDKNLPGLMMGMVRCNVPSVFVYGGSALPGSLHGKPMWCETYETTARSCGRDAGRGARRAGARLCRPVGRVSGAIHRQHHGHGVGSARICAARLVDGPGGVRGARRSGAKRGEVVMQLQHGGPLAARPGHAQSLENACAIVAATGGSTNAALHLPAIAHEAGIRFTLDDVAEVFERTPLIANLRPGGDYLAQDVHYVGGVPMIAKRCSKAAICTVDRSPRPAETLAQAARTLPLPDGDVVRTPADPISPTGGVVVLKGNLAPDGALIKIAGLNSLAHEGPARVFESEEACMAVIRAAPMRAATCSSSATKAPRAAPACARCSVSPR